MRARVTKPFPGVKDGEIHPTDFIAGDEIHGDLARSAVGAGTAEMIEDDPPHEKEAWRPRRHNPTPPQPNNPPSPAAVGTAGLRPADVQRSSPRPGSETALPAAATIDQGASTIEGANTPAGGKTAPAEEVKKEPPPANKAIPAAPTNK